MAPISPCLSPPCFRSLTFILGSRPCLPPPSSYYSYLISSASKLTLLPIRFRHLSISWSTQGLVVIVMVMIILTTVRLNIKVSWSRVSSSKGCIKLTCVKRNKTQTKTNKELEEFITPQSDTHCMNNGGNLMPKLDKFNCWLYMTKTRTDAQTES